MRLFPPVRTVTFQFCRRHGAAAAGGITLSGVILAGSLLPVGSAAASPAAGDANTTAGVDFVNPSPGTITESPGAVSPDSSGQAPSSQMPTGPVTPGSAPGTLVATLPGGQKLPCSTPGNPYSGAKVSTVFRRPGVAVRRYSKSGRTPLYVVVANIGNSGAKVRPSPLMYGGVSTLSTLRQKISNSHAFAATNGDFFHLGQDGSPYGAEVTRGGTVQKGVSRHQSSLILQRNRTETVGSVWLSVPIKARHGVVRGQSWNSQYLPRDGTAVFTPNWGSASRVYLHPSQQMREYVVRRHKVVAQHSHITSTHIPSDGYIIVAQGRAVNRLRAAGVGVGHAVAAAKYLHSTAPHGVDTAIGVGMALVHSGRYQGPVCSQDNAVARTIVGILPGGKRMFIAVAQGQTDSAHSNFSGLTARESTALAYHLKATEAVMFDGGGSAGVTVRGDYGAVSQYTRSADGWDRFIPNGYGFWKR